MKKIVSVFFILFTVATQAQQLDKIGLKQGVKVNGGMSFANNFYSVSGISNRLNPYSYFLTGNLNINLYGIAVPLSFSYSNQNFSYRQPFNIIGASPTYKKFKAHIGYRNLSFSPYTLSGHNFLGGGFEYNGEKIAVVIMAGRLLKAVDYDSSNVNALPAFKRLGGGIKLTYKNKGDEFSLINFYAKDDIHSIDSVPVSYGLQAQQNVVWGVSAKKLIGKKFTIGAELAKSAWTKDITAEPIANESSSSPSIFYIKFNQSTLTYNAMKFNVNYNFTLFTVGAAYERVDPEYRTLGSYYFNNDLENITINASTALFKKKVTLSGSGGLQHDDLNKLKASQMQRAVGSLTMGIAATKRLNLNFSYSNFYSYLNIKPVGVNLIPGAQIDTLNYTQISQTFTGSVSYKLLESDHASKMINFSSSQMSAQSKQHSSNQKNNLLNATLGYTISWKKSSTSLGFSLNGNQSTYDTTNTLYVGLGINGSMPLMHKKIRASLGVNGNSNYQNSILVAYLISINNSYSYKLSKHHSLAASIRYTGRTKIANDTAGRYNTSFNEFLGSITYNYNF